MEHKQQGVNNNGPAGSGAGDLPPRTAQEEGFGTHWKEVGGKGRAAAVTETEPSYRADSLLGSGLLPDFHPTLKIVPGSEECRSGQGRASSSRKPPRDVSRPGRPSCKKEAFIQETQIGVKQKELSGKERGAYKG